MNSEEGSSERSGRPAQTEREAQPARVEELWEAVFSRDNLNRALQRVESNKGAPGVDAMTVAELRPWLKVHWPEVRAQLEAGTYRPVPVRRVSIPKPEGGERELGVPTVLDRNAGTCDHDAAAGWDRARPDAKGRTPSRWNGKGQSTDAGRRDGPPRSSDEAR